MKIREVTVHIRLYCIRALLSSLSSYLLNSTQHCPFFFFKSYSYSTPTFTFHCLLTVPSDFGLNVSSSRDFPNLSIYIRELWSFHHTLFLSTHDLKSLTQCFHKQKELMKYCWITLWNEWMNPHFHAISLFQWSLIRLNSPNPIHVSNLWLPLKSPQWSLYFVL